jgi:hypothetical protein
MPVVTEEVSASTPTKSCHAMLTDLNTSKDYVQQKIAD